MVDTYGLEEVMIPENQHIPEELHSKPKCNIFISPEFRTPDVESNRGRRALVLIQGSGAVRAGMWARSVCINESLELGSMLPFLSVCRDLNIPVLVMNPNANFDPTSREAIPLGMQHEKYVWGRYVKDSGFDQISIVAHSAGGGGLMSIQTSFADTFYDMVSSIAYTDSWVISKQNLNPEQKKFMFLKAVHYEASQRPLDSIISANMATDTCPIRSAGHIKHEYTTGTSQYSILK